MYQQKLFFIYTHTFVSLAAVAGAQGQATILISKESDFECNYITLVCKQANAIVDDWDGLLQMSDNSPGRTTISQPLSYGHLNGNGRQPYPLNPSRLFEANTSITIEFTNGPGGTATEVQIALHGNKLFSAGRV